MKNKDKKIFYIGYYGDTDADQKRKSSPAADTKMKYIFNVLKKNDYDVKVLSFCIADNRKVNYKKYNGYIKEVDNVSVQYFSSYASKFRIIRILGRWITKNKQFAQLKREIKDDKSEIIFYHSPELFKVYKYLNKRKIKFTLEVEEIYSDLLKKHINRDKEIELIRLADKFIFPTELLNKEVNRNNCPYIVCHGTYQVENTTKVNKFNDNKIHCVYAGTFEPRKGVEQCINCASFLSSKYHMHVIGYGTNQQVENVKGLIKRVSKSTKAVITYDGLLTGDKYIEFLQKCTIGLSPQNPDASFNLTSFPSKILSYMSSGLRVVSIRIPAIETSDVGNDIFYYDKQEPKELAKVIESINVDDEYDGKKIITKLDKRFEKELREMLDE